MALTERQQAAHRRNALLWRARNLLRECEVALPAEQKVLKIGVRNWLESFQRDVEK